MATARTITGSSFLASTGASTTVYNDDDLLYVVLDRSAWMRIILRTAQELFQDTVDRERGRLGLSVIVNGNFYELTLTGKMQMLAGAAGAGETTPIGLLVDSGRVLGGKSAPQHFNLACAAGPLYGYQAAFGDASAAVGTSAAIGGLGPMIVDGLKYGVGNRYRAGTPAGAPATGQPPPQYAANLVQRNNETYKSAAALGPRVGKTVIAYSSANKKLMVLVQPHGASTGISHDDLRDKLFDVGCDQAVFLDGSDSVMLNVTGVWHVRQAWRKDRTNTIGVGFSL